MNSMQLAHAVLINKLGALSPEVQEEDGSLSDFDNFAQKLPQPLTSTRMDAIKILVEKGNQFKNKKQRRVVPTTGEGEQIAAAAQAGA